MKYIIVCLAAETLFLFYGGTSGLIWGKDLSSVASM
jgi:hypothetical protein